MHIAVVSTYPPSLGSLNEYAYHFVAALREKPEVTRLSILADELPQGVDYHEFDDDLVPTEIVPCWRFGAWNNALRIRNTIADIRPDVVLFNIQFASFAGTRAAAAAGLTAPILVKMTTGILTTVLLHNIMETVDLESAGFGASKVMANLTRMFGTLLTRMLLATDMIMLTIPKYVDILRKKYHADNVMLTPHGSFDRLPSPDRSREADNPFRILAFGKFGTYKRVESLLQAFHELQQRTVKVLELVIAGTDNPNAQGYLKRMQTEYSHVENVRYTGYVAENDVPVLFQSSDVVVFPYSSTTGSSGVLHQAGSYGCPVVLPNLGDFAELIMDEGYIGEFFIPEDSGSIAEAIESLLNDPVKRTSQGHQNYLAAQGVPLSDVVDWYLLHFEHLIQADHAIATRTEYVQVENNEEKLLVRPYGRFDIYQSKATEAVVQSYLDTKSSPQVIFECGSVTFIDQPTIEMIHKLEVLANERGGRLDLINVSQVVRIILEMQQSKNNTLDDKEIQNDQYMATA